MIDSARRNGFWNFRRTRRCKFLAMFEKNVEVLFAMSRRGVNKTCACICCDMLGRQDGNQKLIAQVSPTQGMQAVRHTFGIDSPKSIQFDLGVVLYLLGETVRHPKLLAKPSKAVALNFRNFIEAVCDFRRIGDCATSRKSHTASMKFLKFK